MPKRFRPPRRTDPKPQAKNGGRINPNEPFVKVSVFLLGLLLPALAVAIIAGVLWLSGR